MKTKEIYTKKIAYELRLMGNKIIRTEPNPNKPEFDVWIFKDTKKLEDDLTKISQEYKDQKEKNKYERKDKTESTLYLTPE